MTITIEPETVNRILLFLTSLALLTTILIMFAMHLRNEADIRAEQAEAARLRELND